jgi:predicted acylesterase/phospholipase RssA
MVMADKGRVAGRVAIAIGAGGVLGCGLLGACQVLQRKGYVARARCIGGVSVGAIIALFLSLNVDLDSLGKDLVERSWKEFKDILDPFSMYEQCGLMKGDKILEYVAQHTSLLRPGMTFRDIFKLTQKQLVVGAYNLTKQRTEWFDTRQTPDMSVMLAIRMSMAVPYLFTPCKYKGQVYIDGGIRCTTPCRYLRHCDPEAKMIIVKRQISEENKLSCELSLYRYSAMLAQSLMLGRKEEYEEEDTVIEVNMFNYGVFDFGLERDERLLLYKLGSIAAEATGSMA